MVVPKIVKVTSKADMVLDVTFENGEMRELDIKPYLTEFEPFRELENPALFGSARVDVGGMGIVWNDRVDLSRYDAWEFGKAI